MKWLYRLASAALLVSLSLVAVPSSAQASILIDPSWVTASTGSAADVAAYLGGYGTPIGTGEFAFDGAVNPDAPYRVQCENVAYVGYVCSLVLRSGQADQGLVLGLLGPASGDAGKLRVMCAADDGQGWQDGTFPAGGRLDVCPGDTYPMAAYGVGVQLPNYSFNPVYQGGSSGTTFEMRFSPPNTWYWVNLADNSSQGMIGGRPAGVYYRCTAGGDWASTEFSSDGSFPMASCNGAMPVEMVGPGYNGEAYFDVWWGGKWYRGWLWIQGDGGSNSYLVSPWTFQGQKNYKTQLQCVKVGHIVGGLPDGSTQTLTQTNRGTSPVLSCPSGSWPWHVVVSSQVGVGTSWVVELEGSLTNHKSVDGSIHEWPTPTPLPSSSSTATPSAPSLPTNPGSSGCADIGCLANETRDAIYNTINNVTNAIYKTVICDESCQNFTALQAPIDIWQVKLGPWLDQLKWIQTAFAPFGSGSGASASGFTAASADGCSCQGMSLDLAFPMMQPMHFDLLNTCSDGWASTFAATSRAGTSLLLVLGTVGACLRFLASAFSFTAFISTYEVKE